MRIIYGEEGLRVAQTEDGCPEETLCGRSTSAVARIGFAMVDDEGACGAVVQNWTHEISGGPIMPNEWRTPMASKRA